MLEPANLPEGGAWADLGAGSGAFTLALRELVGPKTTIYAVDKDRIILKALEHAYARRFADVSGLRTIAGDFSRGTDLPLGLDGILMANSLHFFKEKESILRRVGTLLKSGGLLLLVEYNVDKGNPWVPFPLSFKTFQQLAIGAGFSEPRLVASHPSSFLREFYSAAANVL